MLYFMSTIRNLFRKDNAATWLPMLGSLVGALLGPAYAIFIEENPSMTVFFITAGMIFFFVYLLLVFRYIQPMYTIYKVFRSDQSMWRTCAYLACLSGNTLVNNFKLQKINIAYTLGTPSCRSTGLLAYPFSVEYDVYGLVTQPFSVIYYHTLGLVHKNKHVSIEYAFGDSAYISADDSNYCSRKNIVTFYKFISDSCYQKGDLIHYKIKLTFDIERGIAVEEIQRLLFNPSNITVNCKDIIAQITLSCPVGFKQHFNTLHLTQYVNGFGKVPNCNEFRFMRNSSGIYTDKYCCRIKLDADQLYAIPFIARSTPPG